MLSYQHGYHAGNLADVHKHSLLAWMLSYMTAKDKPLCYLETHAGRGLYDLQSDAAKKTGEAAQGIAQAQDWFAPDHPYTKVLSKIRATHGAQSYPGSPVIAAEILRHMDNIHLAELHPQEYAALAGVMAPYGGVFDQCDGWQMALSRSPPTPRRGLLLIDPSFEVKTDYQTAPVTIAHIHRKWGVGVLMLWYPILTDAPHHAMIRTLQSAIPTGLTHQVSFPPSRPGHRMVGSGVFVVNPPYGFADEAAKLTKLFDGKLKSK